MARRLRQPTAFAKFLIERVNDSDPTVREAILRTLENSKIRDVEEVVSQLREKEAKTAPVAVVASLQQDTVPKD